MLQCLGLQGVGHGLATEQQPYVVLTVPILQVRNLKLSLTSGEDLSKEKWVAEDEMVRYRPRHSGHESEQILGDSGDREDWRAAVHVVAKSHNLLTEQQQFFLYDLSGKSPLLTKALLISKKAPR